MDNNEQLPRVYNDAIYTRMLQMLQITCGFVLGAVQKWYKAQLNFKELNYCHYSYLRLQECYTIMDNNQQLLRVYNDSILTRILQILQIICGFVSAAVQKWYKAQLNFKKLNYCFIIDISGVTIVVQSCTIINSQKGCTMMPFGPECCERSKSLVGLFREPYRNGTRHN